MSPGDRCDEILRIIDATLSDDGADEEGADEVVVAPDDHPVESPSGTWGVFYLRPA